MKNVMNAANKPVLADAIRALVPHEVQIPAETECVYVIDGGSLLHRIPWQKMVKLSWCLMAMRMDHQQRITVT